MKLCPHAVMLPPRIGHYAGISREIHAIFARFTPLIEPLSLDEAFLDVTESLKLFGSAGMVGHDIQLAIRNELGLAASIGIGPNKFIAKIASDIDKPNGFVCIKPEDVRSFLDPLPVERIWGVGQVTAKTFARANLHTIGELRRLSKEQALSLLGRHGDHFWQLAHGMDERPVIAEHEAKSISRETTFAVDIRDREALSAWLLDLTEQVMRRLRNKGLRGRTIHLKIRFDDFTTIVRSHTLKKPTDITHIAWQTVHRLFVQHLPADAAVRLIGMGIDGFDSVPEKQGELFATPEIEKLRAVDHVVDDIQTRFGNRTLKRGTPPKNRPFSFR